MTATTVVLVVAIAIGAGSLLLRRRIARHGHGRLGQVEFRRRHGDRVAQLLDGEVDSRRHSPWIAIRFGGRGALLVAALVDGRLQAGIQLVEHELGELAVLHATGEPEEVVAPPALVPAACALALRLAAVGVENVASPGSGATPVLRLWVRDGDVERLPAQLAEVAPLLEELEALAAQAPNDWAQ